MTTSLSAVEHPFIALDYRRAPMDIAGSYRKSDSAPTLGSIFLRKDDFIR